MASIYIRDFPDDLHRRFKAHCSLRGESMRERVIGIIREYVEKEDKKAKK